MAGHDLVVRTTVSKIGAHRRWRPEEPVPEDLLAELAAARIEQAVAAIVADAPALTPERRDRIAALLFAAPTRARA